MFGHHHLLLQEGKAPSPNQEKTTIKR